MSEYTEQRYNFPPIIKGCSYYWSFQITQDDEKTPMPGLTGATLSCVVKSFPGGPTLQDLTSKFTLTPSNATVTLSLTDAETTAITWSGGFYHFILKLLSGHSKCLFYGEFPVDLG
jgi:hypothetical protein